MTLDYHISLERKDCHNTEKLSESFCNYSDIQLGTKSASFCFQRIEML